MLLPIALTFGLWTISSVTADPPSSPTALIDEIWKELDTHDPFFDRTKPEIRAILRQARARMKNATSESERLREVVRALSGLQDGHTHLTTRWFLPDKPPPPLPLAGRDPLFRPAIHFIPFHRDDYMRLEFPDEPRDNGRTHVEECRVREVDGALLPGAWSLFVGPENSTLEIEFERPDGRVIRRSFARTLPVKEPKHYAPTTQIVVKTPTTTKTTTVELVVDSARLDANIGYIRIAHLVHSQVVKDFNTALDRLMDTDGLILDLRDCGGGYPWIMLPITGRFFDQFQEVCSFDGKSPLIKTLVRMVGRVGIEPSDRPYTKPLAVLINDGTGSMSEGMAFSLGDTGRAILVGRPTMGLNAAIRNTTLSNGLVLWHSWIRVNRLNGTHYQNVGVQPHDRIEVSPAELRKLGIRKAVEIEYQRQLDHAWMRVRDRIAALNPHERGPASRPAHSQH